MIKHNIVCVVISINFYMYQAGLRKC